MASKPKSVSAEGNLYDSVAASLADSVADGKVSKQVSDSAQEIWLAGLGAFSRVQSEGRKVFDALVKQGEVIEQNTRQAAASTLAEVREYASEQASNTFEFASRKYDKLEEIFENRVRQSLLHLGVASRADLESLAVQVAALSARVNALSTKTGNRKTSAEPKKADVNTTKTKEPLRKSSATKPITKIHKKINTSKRK